MKIEHVGYMVADPLQAADWYCQNLGFRIVRGQNASPFTHFLIDSDGTSLVEIYNNPAASVPDYASMDPLVFHIAFQVADESIEAARDRLLSAGAKLVSDVAVTPAGDRLTMLRDPWGLAIQLAQRKTPME